MTYHRAHRWAGWIAVALLSLSVGVLVPACGDDNGGSGGTGGTGGAAGTGGTGGSTGTTFDLSFSGIGFQAAHDGQTMYFALYDDADDSAPVDTWQLTVDQDPLVFSRADELVEGKSYTLYYYADVNGNGTCDGPAINMDHAWSQSISTVSADVEITDTHSLNFNGDCSKH